MSYYSTDKTSLEIKNALLTGKDVLLKLNNQTVGKILYYSCLYDDYEQNYYVNCGSSNMNISVFTYTYNTIEAAKNNEDFLIVQIYQPPNDSFQ